MRKTLLLGAALVLAAPNAYALYPYARIAANALASLVTPTALPRASVMLGADNALTGSATNNGFKTNGGSFGAFTLPSTTTKSWFVFAQFQVNPYMQQSFGTAAETLFSATIPTTTIGCASSASCPGGSDRAFRVGIPGNNVPLSIVMQLAYGGSYWWQTKGVSLASFVGGSGYTQGAYPWTATGGPCTTRAPAGYLHVNAVGAIDLIHVTDPGQCSGAAAPTVSVAGISGIGAGSGGSLTLTMGYTTGILVQPGQKVTCIAGEFGGDTADTAPGLQYVACVDQNGVALKNSPAVSYISNQGTAGFTGQTTTSSTVLTVTGTPTGTIWPGMTIGGAGVTTAQILPYGTSGATGTGGAGTYILSAAQATGVGPEAMTSANEFFYSNTTGAVRAQTTLGEAASLIGSALSTSTTANQQGWGGAIGALGMIYGEFPNSTCTAGASSGCIPNMTLLGEFATGALDPYAYFTANPSTYTVHSFYSWNAASAVLTDLSGNYAATTPLIASPTAAQTPLAAEPVATTAALALNDHGAYAFHAITNQTTGAGSVVVDGTYNASALGGTPAAIQARISSTAGSCTALSSYAPGCAWTNIGGTLGGGAFSGSLPGVPAGGPYYVSVRASNGTGYVFTGGPIMVGEVIALFGQSQAAFLLQNSWAGNSLSLASGLHAYVGPIDPQVALTYSYSPFLTTNAYTPAGAVAVRPLTPLTLPGSSVNGLGDGGVALIRAMTAVKGWPVEILNLARPGEPADIWNNGYVSQSKTVAGGSTTLSSTLTFAESSLGISCPGCAGGAPYPHQGGVANTILAGTAQVFNGATLIAQDNQAAGFGVGGSTNCTGFGAYAGLTCSINYLTGAISFVSATNWPASTTVKWTNIVDLAPWDGTGITQVPASQYDAWDWWGNGGPSSGFVSAVMSHAPAGLDAIVLYQCTGNQNDFTAYPYANAAASHSAKWNYAATTKLQATFPQVSSSTPVVVVGHPRDVNPAFGTVFQQSTSCLQWSHDAVNSSSGAYIPNALPGGDYPDIANVVAGLNTDSPHATSGSFGAQRVGKRLATNLMAVWGWLTAAQPAIAGAAFDNTSTYNAACATTPYSCIDITVTLNQGTSLATCGANLTGGVYPPAGTCSRSTATGQHVEGFRIGASQNPFANGDVYEDGFDPYAVSYTQSGAFNCTLVVATVVQCVKGTGSWTSGATWLSYGDNMQFSRLGTLTGNAGGTGLTVSAHGTCSGSGTSTVATTGGGFTTAPTIAFTYTSASGITAAYPATPGLAGTSAPTVVLPAGCTGATISGLSVGTSIGDANLMGQLLYDNSAASGALNTIFSGADPGLPLTPAGIGTMLAVTG